jgi:hypothetical protein
MEELLKAIEVLTNEVKQFRTEIVPLVEWVSKMMEMGRINNTQNTRETKEQIDKLLGMFLSKMQKKED